MLVASFLSSGAFAPCVKHSHVRKSMSFRGDDFAYLGVCFLCKSCHEQMAREFNAGKIRRKGLLARADKVLK